MCYKVFMSSYFQCSMDTIHQKNLNSPEETREFDKGKLEIVTLAGVIFGRATFQPGWKWSTSIKPIAKTNSCQSSHTQHIISGRMMVKMDDGKQVEFGPC
jgi:hypothetical protein